MNRPLTALFAGFEALLVVAIGVAIPLLPLTALWAFHYGLALDWAVFWRAAIDIWLLGHGVDVRFALDPETATALGFPGAQSPVQLTIALLGFALLTVLLGVRAGRRIAETRARWLGAIVSLGVFGLSSVLLTFSALHPLARPSLVQGALLPTLVFAVGLVIGVRPDRLDEWIGGWFRRRPASLRAVVTTALRGGAAAAAAVMAAAALVTAGAIVLGYARIITLYESLHGEVLGGIAITVGQLALLPNLVIWAASWLVGPGFAIGAGSSVGPLGTALGPLPAIPVLGALPTGESAFGFVGLAIPVAAGFLVGAALGPRVRDELAGARAVVAGLGVGAVGGVILGVLAWWSGGAAGPGRLAQVGPDPWAVGLVAALELGAACTLGMLAARRRPPAGSRGPGR